MTEVEQVQEEIDVQSGDYLKLHCQLIAHIQWAHIQTAHV